MQLKSLQVIPILMALCALAVPFVASAAGGVGAWTTTTPMPSAVSSDTMVYLNGYVYIMGGQNSAAQGLATVNYAPINADGTISSWGTTSSMPVGEIWDSSVASNGYVYAIGGYRSSNSSSGVYYAQQNADGTLGSWSATASLPQIIDFSSAATLNGYIYVVGGISNTTLGFPTVYYAQVQANGSLGAWQTTTALPVAIYSEGTVIANGRLYVIGGGEGSRPGTSYTTVYYASINADGTLGAWQTTTSLPSAYAAANLTVAMNNYLYVLFYQCCTTNAVSISYANINADGTLGAWQTTTSIPQGIGGETALAVNEHLLTFGGYSGGYLSTVYISQFVTNCPSPIGTTSDGFGFNLLANIANYLVNKFTFNFCVSNSSALHYFIPAKTSAELQSFVNAIPRLTGVSQQSP